MCKMKESCVLIVVFKLHVNLHFVFELQYFLELSYTHI